eukprot:433227_1
MQRQHVQSLKDALYHMQMRRKEYEKNRSYKLSLRKIFVAITVLLTLIYPFLYITKFKDITTMHFKQPIYDEMSISINKPFEKFDTSLSFSDYPFNKKGWFFDDYRNMINNTNLTLQAIQKISSPQLLITKYKINKFEFPITNPSIINIANIENYQSYMLKTISNSQNAEIIKNAMYILMGKWGKNQCDKCHYNDKGNYNYKFPGEEMQKYNHLNGIGLILFDKKWNVLSYVKMETNQYEHKHLNERWSPFEDCKLFDYLSMLYFHCVAHQFNQFPQYVMHDTNFFGGIFWKEQKMEIVAYIEWTDTTNNVSQILKTKRLVHMPPKHIKYRKPKNLIPFVYDNKLYYEWSLLPNYVINVDVNKNTNDSISGEYAYYNDNNNNSFEINEYHQNTGFLHLTDSNEYLGIAHIHYNLYDYLQLGTHEIMWGSHYSHVFFTIEDKPPFNLKRMSSQFCFVSPFTQTNGRKDCDVIQFVVGMTESKINNMDYVFISYGINDCISSVIVFNKTFVINMLR